MRDIERLVRTVDLVEQPDLHEMIDRRLAGSERDVPAPRHGRYAMITAGSLRRSSPSSRWSR